MTRLERAYLLGYNGGLEDFPDYCWSAATTKRYATSIAIIADNNLHNPRPSIQRNCRPAPKLYCLLNYLYMSIAAVEMVHMSGLLEAFY